jgi:NADH-quinone oxidoreductase subunit C
VDARAIFDRIGGAAHELTEAPEPSLKVAPDRLLEAMRLLRDDPDLRFDFLQNLTAVDWIERQQVQCVYHLWSYAHRHEIAVKVDLPRAAPRVPSVAGLWRNAEWLEREQFDLLGVVFEGHPDLRRLLLPDDWVGHPMRKDYREASEYRGMPTTRPSPIDILAGYDKAPKR